jgi:hypothetical protein
MTPNGPGSSPRTSARSAVSTIRPAQACFTGADLTCTSAWPSSGWLAVSVIAPGWPGSERIQTAPSPPYWPNVERVVAHQRGRPGQAQRTWPLPYLRWLPKASMARNTARVASDRRRRWSCRPPPWRGRRQPGGPTSAPGPPAGRRRNPG